MQKQIPVSIRAAVSERGETILSMLAKLALWEGASHMPRLDHSALARDVFGDDPKLRIVVAEKQSGQLVGFISYYENYSSWQGAVGIHIGDLWVALACRGQSIGSALLNHVTGQHEKRRIDVFVIRSNEARFFYERLGFKEQTQWALYRKEPQ